MPFLTSAFICLGEHLLLRQKKKKEQDNRIESCLWAAVWIWHELLMFTLNCAVESRVIVASISQLVNSDNNVEKKKGKDKRKKKRGKSRMK